MAGVQDDPTAQKLLDLVKDERIWVIEANPRASRTVPFVSKVIGVSLARIATWVLTGRTLAELGAGLTPAAHEDVLRRVDRGARVEHVRPADEVLVQHQYIALTDRAHRELGLVRQSQFPDDEDVQGSAERTRDLVGHRDSATRQRELAHLILFAALIGGVLSLAQRCLADGVQRLYVPRATLAL